MDLLSNEQTEHCQVPDNESVDSRWMDDGRRRNGLRNRLRIINKIVGASISGQWVAIIIFIAREQEEEEERGKGELIA